MTRLGDISIPETLYDEKMISASLGWQLATNQSTTGNVYTYTMPMTGMLTVALGIGVSWSNNIQGFQASLANSTPAPNYGFGVDQTENGLSSLYMFSQSKMLHYWANLAKGTVVNINVTLTCSFYAPTITGQWVNGWLRASRQ